jgi:hypothetical protein
VWKSTDLPNHQNWAHANGGNGPIPRVGANTIDATYTLSLDGTRIVVAYTSVPSDRIQFKDFSLLTGLWGAVYGTNAPFAKHVNNLCIRADGTYVVTYSPDPASGSNIWAAISAPGVFSSWVIFDVGTNYTPFSGGATALNANVIAMLADGQNTHVIYRDGNAPPTYIYQLINPNNTLGLMTKMNTLQTIVGYGNLVKFGCYIWLGVQGQTTDNHLWAMFMPVSQPGLWGKVMVLDPETIPSSVAGVQVNGPTLSTDGQSIVMTFSLNNGIGGTTRSWIWACVSRDGITWATELVYDSTDANNTNPPHLDVTTPFIFAVVLYKSGPGYQCITCNAVSTLDTASNCALFFPFTPAMPSLCASSYGSVIGTGGGGGAAGTGVLPPPPIMTPLLNERGTPTLPWVAWFNAVYQTEISGV